MKMPCWIAAALALCVGLAGCNRAYYRRQADTEVNCLVDHKASIAGSDVGAYRIELDPRSRMFSPECPDCPAMPPDDPVSHSILQCVDGKLGARSNRHAPRTPFVENPDWLSHLPRNEAGELVLDISAAVDVALVQSPDYQDELEELYLSALDVTFERFQFDSQFFGGSSIFFTADGRDRSGSGNSSSLLEVAPSRSGNRFRLEKFTATGGELVVGLANSLVWQFAGPDNYTSSTLLDFSLVQPLLRRGGRTVVLERLTIVERALLANVRSMERFRRGFYLNVVTGRDAGQGPTRRGGFFGGSGLDGFTGVGGGGFGRVGGGGGGFTGGAGAAAASGYIGLLQQTQELRNQRANVIALRGSVEQLAASNDAGRIDRFQVDLARQALFNAQSRLLSAEVDYQTSVDSFVVDLGLPPNIPLRLSDDLLEPFQLRSAEIVELQSQSVTLASELRARSRSAESTDNAQAQQGLPQDGQPEPDAQPVGGPEVIAVGPAIDSNDPSTSAEDDLEQPPEKQLAELAAEASRLAADARTQLDAVDQDFQNLQAALPKRREHLAQISSRKEVAEAQIDDKLLSPGRLDERFGQLSTDWNSLRNRAERILQTIEAQTSPSVAAGAELRKNVTDLSSLLLELSLVQARARLDTIDIEPTDLNADDALTIASLFRRDWKNARAALVDSWRLINFNANDLLSDLDLTFSGDIGNVGDNPFRLRDTNGRLRVGLAFDGPLTRLGERNNYRQALIEYGQSRRSYYRFVDQVYQGLRASLRQVRLNEINFELRREAVFVAIAQVDLTQLRLSEPPKPGEESQFGETTARDLVQSLADLLSVQNDFLSVWVNNRVQQLNLEYDLGLMQLDASGQRVPLAMPLADFLNAFPCDEPLDAPCDDVNGPQRSGGDIELLQPISPCPPAQDMPELLFSPDVSAAVRQDSSVHAASFVRPGVSQLAPQRLPAP